jgi:hypothetical protein
VLNNRSLSPHQMRPFIHIDPHELQLEGGNLFQSGAMNENDKN